MLNYPQIVPVEYYKSMPIEKETIKFRFVKFELADGSWMTWEKLSSERLRRLLVRYNPKNAYISVQKYLYYKEFNNTYKNIQIGKEELIDIDGQDFKDKREVWAETNEILKFLEENNAEILDVVLTNTSIGGYQISLNNPNEKLINDLSKKFNVDKRVLDDPKRVKRLVFSYNGNKGSFSTRIGMPVMADDSIGVKADISHKTRSGEGNYANLPRHYGYKQVSSSVQGTKGMYVPVFRFSRMPSKKRIRKLQQRYNTGSLVLHKFFDKYYLVGFKAHQKERIRKMYRFMKCYGSLNQLDKYKANWIPIGNAVDLDNGGEPIGGSYFNERFYQDNADGNYSKGHLFIGGYLTSAYGFIGEKWNLIGEEQPVYTAIYRNTPEVQLKTQVRK